MGSERQAAVEVLNHAYSMQRMRFAMGTFCVIAASGLESVVETAIVEAFTAVATIEQLLHPMRTGSDLQRLNDSCANTLQVHPHTWSVLKLSQRLCRLSDGYFDPCLPTRVGSINDLELNDGNQVLCRRPVSIDLGGIAKGYAVDRAVDALRTHGCDAGIVNVGGDLRLFGRDAQTVVVRQTNQEDVAFVLSECALAASDALSDRHPPEFRGYYSRIGTASLPCKQAVVIASSAAVADALTKCAIVCDEILLHTMAEHLHAEIALRQ
jgi:thiamine biosynthesis lipoprotein